MLFLSLLLILLLCELNQLAHSFQSFISNTNRSWRKVVKPNRSFLQMGLGDILKKALANDPNMTPAQNPGLSKAPEYVNIEFVKGSVKKQVRAIKGEALRTIASQAGVAIKYSCKKGECRTCEVTLNGKTVKACQSYLPGGSVTVIIPDKI